MEPATPLIAAPAAAGFRLNNPVFTFDFSTMPCAGNMGKVAHAYGILLLPEPSGNWNILPPMDMHVPSGEAAMCAKMSSPV